MLVLTRKRDESIIIGDDIEITIIQIMEDRVKIGITAPRDMKVFRKELIEAVEKENIISVMVDKENIRTIKDLIKTDK